MHIFFFFFFLKSQVIINLDNWAEAHHFLQYSLFFILFIYFLICFYFILFYSLFIYLFIYSFIFFLFYGPFKNISLISSWSFIKGGRKPEKNHLTIRKQNLAFPHVSNGSNHSGEKPNGLRVNSPIHQATGVLQYCMCAWCRFITKTRLLKYIESSTTKNWKFSENKIGYFSNFCSKHRLWAIVRTASPRRF